MVGERSVVAISISTWGREPEFRIGVGAIVGANWITTAAVAICGSFVIGAAIIIVHVRRPAAQAQKLVQAVGSLDLGSSTTADVELIQEWFRQYQVSGEQADGLHSVLFPITNQPLPRLKIQPFALLRAGIGIQDGKVVSVDVGLRSAGDPTKSSPPPSPDEFAYRP
jgi:hypothetical protein